MVKKLQVSQTGQAAGGEMKKIFRNSNSIESPIIVQNSSTNASIGIFLLLLFPLLFAAAVVFVGRKFPEMGIIFQEKLGEVALGILVIAAGGVAFILRRAKKKIRVFLAALLYVAIVAGGLFACIGFPDVGFYSRLALAHIIMAVFVGVLLVIVIAVQSIRFFKSDK